MTTARTRQLRGRGHLLRRVLSIVLALVVIGFVADRAITPSRRGLGAVGPGRPRLSRGASGRTRV